MALHGLEYPFHSVTAVEGSTSVPVSVKENVFFYTRENCLAAGGKMA